MRIKNETVRAILDAAKVEDVVGDFVNLRRRGVSMIGLCPFHNEKTPSFHVSPSKNIYKCFGCGKGGDSVNFLMEHEHISYPDALRRLAGKYGIEIEEIELSPEVLAEQQMADSLYIANHFAMEFYQRQLLHDDRGRSVGLAYFKQRGFTEATIQKFGLGYAGIERDALLQAATKAGFKPDALERAGLTKEGRDFFRDRVMFTIHNQNGKVVAFAGRILQKDAKAPKYVNTAETDIYNKSQTLYGMHLAKQAIRKLDECILTEGYTDVISLHQAGVENVVASSGTSLTVEQIRLIKRFTPNVKILYDGDAAGIKAAMRGVDLLLEQDLNVKIVLLPNGEDPDSYMQKMGLTVFKDFLEDKAQDFIFFKANLLLGEAGNDPVKRTAIIKDIVSSMALIPDPIKRSMYVKECARLFDVEEQLLVAEINKLISQRITKFEQQNKAKQAAQATGDFPTEEYPAGNEEQIAAPEAAAVIGDEFQEKELVRLLLQFGHETFDAKAGQSVAAFILSNIDDVIDDFDNALYQRFVKEYAVLLERGEKVDTHHYLHHEMDDVRKLAINLLASPYSLSENWEKKWDIVLNQAQPDQNFVLDSHQSLKRFRLRKLSKLCEANVGTIRELEKSDDIEELLLHLQLQQRLQDMRNALAKELGTVVL